MLCEWKSETSKFFKFIKKVDKVWITTANDLESWCFEHYPCVWAKSTSSSRLIVKSTCLPLTCLQFPSWLDTVRSLGSLFCTDRFSFKYSGFPLSLKTKINNLICCLSVSFEVSSIILAEPSYLYKWAGCCYF